MTSIGKIMKEIVIPHRKGNIRLNPELVVLEDAHIQGFLLGTDYQRMYGIDIHNSKNRHITIGTSKEKKFSLGLLALEHKVSELSLVIDQNKVAEVMQNPVPKNIKEMQSFLGFASYYRNHIKDFDHMTKRRDAYERIKHELTNAPVLILPDFEIPFKLYTDAACIQGLEAALHQRQILYGEPREGVIFYISRKLKDLEGRYGANQTEGLCLFWALEKLNYYLEGAIFEFYTDCTALKSLLNIKTTNRHMLRWQIAIQEYRGNMTIIYKEGKSQTNSNGLSR
ncbi:hypothetical protein O181_017051 [Austropuccinia psidii MF-1]|uniref:Reverse transcriptase RNase H-like domain-containing protein n=1 Tax=Austropuccinia psidii MF-1 TaxID=1389203 RepID=A0A9Q3C6W6_9BASI|nr:hypothetical protein [Austropuccinia psidii MF-1]